MIAKISLSPVFPFALAELHSKFHFPMRLLAERFRGPKPNVLFITVDDLNDWVGCMGHRRPLPEFGPSGRLRRSVRKCPLSGPACNPSLAIFMGFPCVSGLYRNEQKMRGGCRMSNCCPKLFQSGVLVRWFGQDAPLLHRRSFLGRVFPREGNGNPFPKTPDHPSVRLACPVVDPGNIMKPTGGQSMRPMRNTEGTTRWRSGSERA